MIHDEIQKAAQRIAERTRAEQGKPRYVDDAETLSRVAHVLLDARPTEQR